MLAHVIIYNKIMGIRLEGIWIDSNKTLILHPSTLNPISLRQKKTTMIEYIKGELTEVTPTLAVVEAAGVVPGKGILR